MPMQAGLYCDPNAPVSPAPIICSLDSLDGFTATMPTDSLDGYPEFLCSGGGTPNNMSWFAFVAGGPTVDLTLTISNCTSITSQSIGVQAGIYNSCDFDEAEILDCYSDCDDDPTEPINLRSSDFVAGQVYYLFVDGCAGSVCDYTVTVNEGEQAFEMPEITTISNEFNFDLEEDTICQGASVAFRLDDLDLDVGFNWSIEPPTSAYPTGVHPVTDTNVVSFVFSDAGVFDIIVYAFNDCDASEPDTFQVVVEGLEDERFSDVSLCQECIIEGINLVSPDAGCITAPGVPLILTEDPNGDGVAGWLGTMQVDGPGLDTNVVTNIYGCSYEQVVNIIEIPLSPREQITLYRCLEDFPVTYNSIQFASPGDSRNITIENGAASGCDSLQRITVEAIDIFGTTSISDCDGGMISIGFEIIDIQPAEYDSISYLWLDDTNMEVVDSDGIDSTLQVSTVGDYRVEITVYKDGLGCMQTYGPVSVDPDNLVPTTPSIAFAPVDVCVSEGVATIYVDNQSLGEQYLWTTNPVLPLSFGQTTDTLFVDISSGLSFEFCVSASNGCGASDPICDDVVVAEAPNSAFEITSDVCIDSIALVTYLGDDGVTSTSEFQWDFDGGVITNAADPLGNGPFELTYDTPGTYDVTMSLIENGCVSDLTQLSVIVSAPFDPPSLDCESLGGAVLIGFDAAGVDDFNVNVITGQSFSITNMDSILVNGLGTEEEVTVEVTFNQSDVCGPQLASITCSSLPCADVSIDLILDEQDFCIGSYGSTMDLDAMVTGVTTGTGSWSGDFVSNDVFDVENAGPGVHMISYQYIDGACTYQRDTVITIFEEPESVGFTQRILYCSGDTVSQITIIGDEEDEIRFDGEIVGAGQIVSLFEEGTYTLTAESPDGCILEVLAEIEEGIVGEATIDGPIEVQVGNLSTYTVNQSPAPINVQYNWTYQNEAICEDCSEVSLTIENSGELCVEAIYGEGCSDITCLSIEAIEGVEIYVPNAFSPNDDQVNDRFLFQSNTADAMIESMLIFDRWGERVYAESQFAFNEEDKSWDGTFNGRDCAPGVYFFVIRYLDIDGRMVEEKGDITLVR